MTEALARVAADGDDAFPLMSTSTSYLDVLSRLHAALSPEWYLEIGSARGRSLALATGNAVAVDPKFLAGVGPGRRARTHLFQMTSDAFFASGATEALGIRYGLAFLDGLHLFEALLRDFIGAEARAADGGVITLHDCCPYCLEMATRDRKTVQWTGDVWKTLVILLRERPDLKIEVLNAGPTGLVVVRNLDPENRHLSDRLPALTVEFEDMALDRFGVQRFYDLFDLRPAGG